jgi:hypothetical protein
VGHGQRRYGEGCRKSEGEGQIVILPRGGGKERQFVGIVCLKVPGSRRSIHFLLGGGELGRATRSFLQESPLVEVNFLGRETRDLMRLLS